jgi:hypothetical protein
MRIFIFFTSLAILVMQLIGDAEHISHLIAVAVFVIALLFYGVLVVFQTVRDVSVIGS